MLKLVDIRKDYVLKDQEPVHALKGINVNFRKNEFVAILGPSGCGKTTLLNITGGLDRYTSGDLIIQGVSTKDYKDADWDTYRNHCVGFVFQTYNLISHQTVLKNVELALTISGVSRAERKTRALEALEKVGLKGMEKKKPNQMSGGQMQRVAIARALINNPEIVMADEPTGALDSETSVQIMELLKEVAKDRLVIMVTHNPELAEQYATRIVSMKDGVVVSDTNPFDGNEKETENTLINKGSKKQSSMSFKTAMGLSFSNLLSKMKRMVLVTIAGSIGIIGVSAVLAVSQGVRDYIDGMQDDMLSNYPLTISEKAIDYTSLISGLSTWDAKDIPMFDPTSEVGLDSMIAYLMDKYKDLTKIKTNDITKDLLSYIEAAPEGYYKALDYNYGIDPTNNIFTDWKSGKREGGEPEVSKVMSLNGITQMYISELLTVEGFGEYAQFVDLFANFMNQIPASTTEEDYILSQYDLLGDKSRMPESPNEMLLVVDPNNQTLTDILLAQLGYYSEEEFLNIARKAIQNSEDPGSSSTSQSEPKKQYDYPTKFTFDELLGHKFYYYNHDTMYDYQTINERKMSFSLPYPTDDGQTLQLDFSLTYNPDADCLIGKTNIQSKGSVSCILTRTTSLTDPDKPEVGSWHWSFKMSKTQIEANFTFTADGLIYFAPIPFPVGTYSVGTFPTSAYMYEGVAQAEWTAEPCKIVGILKRKPGKNFGCLSRGVYYTKAFTQKYMNDNKESDIVAYEDETPGHTMDGVRTSLARTNGTESNKFQAFVKYGYTSFIKGDDSPIYDVFGYANCLTGGLSISSLLGGSSSAASNDTKSLRSLCGFGTKFVIDPETELQRVEFDDVPSSISIYPKDFADKDKVTKYLDVWNQDVEIIVNGKVIPKSARSELTYTDTIKLIITVINTLIDAITIALVAFTSLALVVSCFMIAVITYISVVERVKEIGIIRSIGGRKKDVSRLFIAETFMTGLTSGVFGLIITYIFQIIFNAAMYMGFKISGIAHLTIPAALIMLLVSITLSVVAGLVPSLKASKQDPVIALRSE